ncbi:uncharacterized protein LOC143249434 isoform X2 [Tachypleus tridentatus]|uniref:uncharacterized protein LOC143249434 isoform X2 n=1 Tax=Tachypleus tridentatus TaxID=6853 RepID=UPI003FD5F480
MVKRSTLRIKSQEIIQSDSSSSDEHETVALRNISSNIKNLDNEKFSLQEKSPSVTSSLSRRHAQKVKNGDTSVISTDVSNSSHLTEVINSVAKGDSLCLDSCSESKKHVSLKRESNLLTQSFDYRTMTNCENPIKMDPAIIFSPIHNGRTPKALPEHKENAIPRVLVNINLSLINRVPVYPPIDRTMSGKDKDKIQSKTSTKSSPREHLKEIKDLNRKSVCLSPMCDNLSSVKSKKISTQSTLKPQKRKAEDKTGNEKKHKISAIANNIPTEAQVNGKNALTERDQFWHYKSSRNCDSPASLSVCSYSSHQSVLSVGSEGRSHLKDKKDQVTKRSKLKEKPLHCKNNVTETLIPHSSNKERDKKVKNNNNETFASCRGIEKYRSKKNLSCVDSKKCKNNIMKESSQKSHNERTLNSCKEMCSAAQEEDGESSHVNNIQSSEHNNNKGHELPVFKHKLYLDHHMKSFSSNNYLNEAKEMKRQADREVDRTVQAMKYLEAVLYFTLTGNAMEQNHVNSDKVYTMYKETLGLIRHISSNFQNIEHTFSSGNIDRRLAVLSLRCQSLLYLKLYRLQRFEIRELHNSLSEFHKSPANQMVSYPSPCHHINCGGPGPNGVPSPHSPTPSPAGSQSSGYSSSELTGYCNTLQSRKGHSSCYTLAPSHLPSTHHQTVGIPQNIYSNLVKQNILLTNLHLCVDLWEEADCLIEHSGSREFFNALDKSCGHLTLHSSFSDLVRYVRAGLYRLKEGT